jgi:hypothetical protein
MNQKGLCLMKAGNSLEQFYIYIILVKIGELSEVDSTLYGVRKTIPELRPPRYLDYLIKERKFLFFMSMVK